MCFIFIDPGEVIPLKMSKKKDRTKITPWSNDEKLAVMKEFATQIRMLKVPGKNECERAKSNAPILLPRSWKNIKYYVKNIITSNRRRVRIEPEAE